MKTNYRATPQDLNRVCSLHNALNMPLAKLPTYYYDSRTLQLPLTTAELDAYNGEVKVFDTSAAQPGRQSNAETGSGVNEPFCAIGVGIVAIGEGHAFTAPGVAVDRPAAAAAYTPASPECVADNEDNINNAAMYHGGPTWEFITNFFKAFRLQIVVRNRFLMVDESLLDVGMVPRPPEFIGAGCSQVPVMPSARAMNDVMAAKGIGRIFLPRNLQVDADGVSSCVGAPTAGVTYGHPQIIGLSNRIFCFNRPLCILPGQRFDVKFTRVENDTAFLAGMRSAAAIHDVELPDATAGSPVGDAAGALNATVSTFPSGTISLGVVFKGFALAPAALFEWVTQGMLPGSVELEMAQGNPYLAGILQSGLKGANLAGVPEHLRGLLSGPPQGE